MRIQDITLTNFRLYRGVNKISFQQDEEGKNIYLISGENGFGKTTFLHSLLWCLYGRLMSEIDDTARKEINNCGGYNSFLVSNLNNNAKQYVESIGSDTISRIKKSSYAPDDEDIQSNAIYSIAITFTDISIPSIPCQTITIIRSYDFIKQSEAIDVLIDNQKNELAQSIGNDVFINDFILNKDIARFFFFDSERIVALAETNTVEDRRRLASAYNEVLGVKKYEDLKHNLEALRLKFRKRTSDVESRNKLNALLDKNEKLQNELQLVNDTIAAHESELEALRQRDKEFQEKLLREGQGMTMDEYERQKAVLDKTREKDAAIREQLRDFMHVGSGSPSHAAGAEMNAIASSIIGGTMLTGGVGNIVGTLFGVLSLALIQNIVSSVGLDDAWWTGITNAAMLCLFLIVQSIIIAQRKKANLSVSKSVVTKGVKK